MDENPYRAPQDEVGSERAPPLASVFRDPVIIAVFVGILTALTAGYVYLIHHVARGMGSVAVNLLHAILMFVCTVIGGSLVNRIRLGLLGILFFWSGWVAFDTVTNEVPFGHVFFMALIPLGVQAGIFTAVWWIASRGSVPDAGDCRLEWRDGREPV